MTSLFNRLNKKALFSLVAVSVAAGVFSSCHKKDRLSSSTFNFHVTPPSTKILKTDTLTLTAIGSSSAGSVPVNPTWEVSPSTSGTLNTSVGATVVFTPGPLGDSTVSATYDGITATSQIAIVTYIPSGNTFDVYNDNGLPTGSGISSDIFTTCDSNFLSERSTGYTPEGIRYQHAEGMATNDFWGVTLDKATSDIPHCNGPTAGLSKNLSSFASGMLKFSMRLGRTVANTEALRVDLTDTGGVPVQHVLVSGSEGFNRLSTDWQEISISISSFVGLNTAAVKVPFAFITQNVATPLSVDVDAIRWEP